tara:strand:- start:578 stop:1207 length:630 start_codon:yes stop_codon:yes gene_type:complete
MKYVRKLEGKAVEGSTKIKPIVKLMEYAFNKFTQDKPFSEVDDSAQLERVRRLKDSKKNQILDDLTSEQLYDIWEDNGKPTIVDIEKIDDLANALYNQAMGKDVIEETKDKGGNTVPVMESGKERKGMIRLRVNFRPTKLVSARDYEIYQKRVDEKGKPMKDLGRRPLGGEGPRTAVELDRQKMQDTEKDFKSLMELKLGYNRLKGLVG